MENTATQHEEQPTSTPMPEQEGPKPKRQRLAKEPEKIKDKNEFATAVKTFVHLDDEFKRFSKNTTRPKNKLKKQIMEFMSENKVNQVKVQESLLYTLTQERRGAIGRKLIQDAAWQFFQVDDIDISREELHKLPEEDQRRMEDCEEFLSLVEEMAGVKPASTFIRQPGAKPKREPKDVPPPMSAFTSKEGDAASQQDPQDEEEDEERDKE